MKKEELYKVLILERMKLYPNGCPVQPRGSAKTNLYLSHFVRYHAYDYVINLYKTMRCDNDITLDKAHKDMENYIKNFWDGCGLIYIN